MFKNDVLGQLGNSADCLAEAIETLQGIGKKTPSLHPSLYGIIESIRQARKDIGTVSGGYHSASRIGAWPTVNFVFELGNIDQHPATVAAPL